MRMGFSRGNMIIRALARWSERGTYSGRDPTDETFISGAQQSPESDEPSRKPQANQIKAKHRVMRAIKHVAIAFVFFCVVGIAMNAALNEIRPNPLRPSWKVLEAASDPGINVIFFGSSHIEYGFVPPVFDAALQAHGITGLRSYNLGQGDASMLESFADSEDLFRLRPRGVKFVVFEPILMTSLLSRYTDTLRAIRYYSLSHAWWSLVPWHVKQAPPAQYLANIGTAVLRHYFGIGLAWAKPDPRGDATQGFPDLDPLVHQRMTDSQSWDDEVAAAANAVPQPDFFNKRELHLVLSFASEIVAHGAVPIVVAPPSSNDWPVDIIAWLDRNCAGQLPLRFDLFSPKKYPELWAPENRFNSDHLNINGAKIFSRLLAEQFRAAIDDNAISRPLCKD